MTDKELKKQLKMAYQMNESDRQRCFVRRYEERSLQFGSIMRIELQHMGIRSVIAGIFLCLLMYVGWRTEDPQVSWVLSSLIPAAALVPVAAMGRSERYHMEELETASRFSYPFVRLIRLLILGSFSLVVLAAAAIWEASCLHAKPHVMLLMTAVPYLLNVYIGLMITRKWHRLESVYAVIAVGSVVCLLPLVFVRMQLKDSVSVQAACGMTLLVLLAIIRECGIYMKESEKTSWNLC